MAVNSIPLRVQLKLMTKPSVVKKRIVSALVKELNRKWAHNTALHRLLNNGVANILLVGMQQSPEYQSLVANDGRLRQELGLRSPRALVDPIIDKASKTTHVVFTPLRAQGHRVTGQIRITALPNNFEDLLVAEPTASYTTSDENIVPWLDWMLRFGDRIIIVGFELEYNPRRSRTGSFIMTPSPQSWRVPPEFSGVVGNNFITRAADFVAPQIANFMKNKLDGVL